MRLFFLFITGDLDIMTTGAGREVPYIGALSELLLPDDFGKILRLHWENALMNDRTYLYTFYIDIWV